MQEIELDNTWLLPKNYTGIVNYSNGVKVYYLNGKAHRKDGPAIIFKNGIGHWYLYGRPHREDGFAIAYTNGSGEYYLHGKEIKVYSTEDLIRLVKLKAFW